MPIKYSLKQKQERINLLNARITIAKAEGDKDLVESLQNTRRNAVSRWGIKV